MLDLAQIEFSEEEWPYLIISIPLLPEDVVELIVDIIIHKEFDLYLLRPDHQLQRKSRANSL